MIDVEEAVAKSRAIAVAIGQEREYDRLIDTAMEASASGVFDDLDGVCDSLVPTADRGIEGTFLPSFALTFLFPLAGRRDSWKRLRDRVVSNKGRSEATAVLVDMWTRDNAKLLA